MKRIEFAECILLFVIILVKMGIGSSHQSVAVLREEGSSNTDLVLDLNSAIVNTGERSTWVQYRSMQ